MTSSNQLSGVFIDSRAARFKRPLLLRVCVVSGGLSATFDATKLEN